MIKFFENYICLKNYIKITNHNQLIGNLMKYLVEVSHRKRQSLFSRYVNTYLSLIKCFFFVPKRIKLVYY